MTPSLYELTEDYAALMDYGMTEEDQEAFETTLEAIKEGIVDKADAYCAVFSQLKGNVTTIKEEEKRLKKMRETIEHNMERMKEALRYTLETMEQSGEKAEIKTALHTIKFHGNGEVQPMEVNEEKVPDSFKMVIYQTDKEKIRKALEAGETLDFAELKPRGRYVEIK